MLRYLTAGESHGKCLLAILDGLVSGLKIDVSKIDDDLRRRQLGYGRGERMKIENDKVEILSGVLRGVTLGSPIALLIKNKDWTIDRLGCVTSPRPGHADLAGAIKYNHKDIRYVLERASARETAGRVAVGALCKLLLKEFGVYIISRIVNIGGAKKEAAMLKEIENAKTAGDTVGGIFEVVAKGVPVGLGSYAQYDRRMDFRLAASLNSIQGIKGIEFGLGFGYAEKRGSKVHDAIFYSKRGGFFRKTNNAGGIEGGITNGESIVIRCCMKPISTLIHPLTSVDIITKKISKAAVERSDICVVSAAGVVGESAVAFELANAFIEKFGGDSLKEMSRNYKGYIKQVKEF